MYGLKCLAFIFPPAHSFQRKSFFSTFDPMSYAVGFAHLWSYHCFCHSWAFKIFAFASSTTCHCRSVSLARAEVESLSDLPFSFSSQSFFSMLLFIGNTAFWPNITSKRVKCIDSCWLVLYTYTHMSRNSSQHYFLSCVNFTNIWIPCSIWLNRLSSPLAYRNNISNPSLIHLL